MKKRKLIVHLFITGDQLEDLALVAKLVFPKTRNKCF